MENPKIIKKETLWDILFYVLLTYALYISASALVGYFLPANLHENTSFLLTLSVTLNMLFFGGSALLYSKIPGKFSINDIGMIPFKLSGNWLFAAALVTGLIAPLRMLLGLLIQMLLDGNLDSLEARSDLFMGGDSLSWAYFLPVLLMVGVLGPISEEIFFRGVIHRALIPHMGLAWRALISSTIFAVGHFDSIGVMVASLVMAFFLALMYELSNKNLWVPISMHVITNSLAVAAMYFSALGG